MRAIGLACVLVALSACEAEPDAEPAPATNTAMASTGDAAIDRKIAEAKAAFAKLSPEEKAKLARQAQATATTLPMTLIEAAPLPVAPAGRPATTLGALAPVGKPTIIAAWASWCVPCKVEARDLVQLQRQYGADRLNIVYLNIGDPKVEAQKAPEFLKEAGAESLGLTMLGQDEFRKLTKLDQISIPRVLPYDRTGKPQAPVTGAVVPAAGADKGDPRLNKAIAAITA